MTTGLADKSRLRKAYDNMLARTRGRHLTPGGRCPWWGKKVVFFDYQDFKEWAMANGYEDGKTLDRVDPDGDYHPANLQWLTKAEHQQKCMLTHKPLCQCFVCIAKRSANGEVKAPKKATRRKRR